jgi:hypothetical protein
VICVYDEAGNVIETHEHTGDVSLGGTITSFSVPGAASTFAYEITDSKQLVVA